MRITYDKMANAAYIQLMEADNRRGIVESSERTKGGEVIVHFTKEGKILALKSWMHQNYCPKSSSNSPHG